MLVTVLGAAGRTGSLVVNDLLQRGHEVRAGVRRHAQRAHLRERGAQDVLLDVTASGEHLVNALTGSDAVINAAAAGSPEPGATEAVDRDAALVCIRAAERAGAARFVQISSMFADRPEQGPPFLQGVLRAKQVADQALKNSSLVWTTVRPGGLTDEAGTGLVRIGTQLSGSTVPRADVAATAAASLEAPAARNRAFDVRGGFTEVAIALRELEAVREGGAGGSGP